MGAVTISGNSYLLILLLQIDHTSAYNLVTIPDRITIISAMSSPQWWLKLAANPGRHPYNTDVWGCYPIPAGKVLYSVSLMG